MGFRFGRSIKLAPGVRLNFSKSGISTSIGGKGATVNYSRKGVRSTIGIPGTGLSYVSSKSYKQSTRTSHKSISSETVYFSSVSSPPKVGFWSVILIVTGVGMSISALANLQKDNNLIWFFCWVSLIALAVFYNFRKASNYKRAIMEQLKKVELERQAEYSKRLSLANERLAQNLLSEPHYKELVRHIENRSLELGNIDQELEKQRLIYSRLNYLNSKYGELALRIINEEFWIGMTREQLIDSKGRQPDKIEVEAMKTKTKEILIYGNKTRGDVFVFENSLLTRYKDK